MRGVSRQSAEKSSSGRFRPLVVTAGTTLFGTGQAGSAEAGGTKSIPVRESARGAKKCHGTIAISSVITAE
jgi:hypothetical protein